MRQKRKLLYWEGSSKKDFKTFPIDVQKDRGVSLFIAQLDSTPEADTIKMGDTVYVLHTFQKKSKPCTPMPQPGVGLTERRLKVVLTHH